MDKVKRLYEWGEWEQHELDQCGCRIRQATDKSVTVDQESLRSTGQPHHDVRSPTQAHVRNTVAEEHNIDGKTWRVELVSDTIHASIVSTTESHRHVESSHRTKSQGLNRLVRQAHCEASDKLHYLEISDLVFVSFQSERCRFSIRISLCRNREVTVGRECCSFLSYFLALSQVSQSCMIIPVRPKLKRQRRHKKRPNSYDSCGWKLCKEVTTTRQLIRKFPRLAVVLIIDAKGVFDAIHRNESTAPPMQDKRSAVEGLVLREAIGRTRTLLRWCHSGMLLTP